MGVTTFLENKVVDGSPQGSQVGVVGNIMEYNGTYYENLGGTNWREVSDANGSIIDRRVDVSTDLVNVVTGPTENVLIADRKTLYKHTGFKQQHAIKMFKDGPLSTDMTAFHCSKALSGVDYSYPTGTFFLAGDTVTMKLRINTPIVIQGGTQSYVFGLPHTKAKLAIYSSGGVNGYVIQSHGSTIEIFDNVGTQISNAVLPTEVWITVKLTYTSSFTINDNAGPGLNNEYGIEGFEFDIGYLEINRPGRGVDIFDFNTYNTSNKAYVSNQDDTIRLMSEHKETITVLPDLDVHEVADKEFNILNPIVPGTFVSPEMLGYDTSLNDNFALGYSASPIIQWILDSPYNLEMPGGNYYIDVTATCEKEKEIVLHGTYERGADDNSLAIGNKRITYVYSDLPIIYWDLMHSDIHFTGGSQSFWHIPELWKYPGDLNPIAIRINPNRGTWGNWIDTSITGDINVLRQAADVGGIGVKIFVDGDADEYGMYGFVHSTKIYVRGTAKNINKGFYIPKSSSGWAQSAGWYNSMFVTMDMNGCKKMVDVQNGSIMTFDIMGQDGAVLVESERDNYAYYLNGIYITHDIFTYDRGAKAADPINNYRHSLRNIYCPGKDNNAIGKSLMGYDNDSVRIPASNWKTIVKDPYGLAITEDKNNIIPHNNQLRGCGYRDSYYFKGYLADETQDIYPQDNAAAISDTDSIGSWAGIVNNPTISSSNSEYQLSARSLQVLQTAVGPTGAGLDIPTVIGAKYTFSGNFRCNSLGAVIVTGATVLIDEDLSLYDWREISYSFVADSTLTNIALYTSRPITHTIHQNVVEFVVDYYYALNTLIRTAAGKIYICSVRGNSNSVTEPDGTASYTDNGWTWTEYGSSKLYFNDQLKFYKNYKIEITNGTLTHSIDYTPSNEPDRHFSEINALLVLEDPLFECGFRAYNRWEVEHIQAIFGDDQPVTMTIIAEGEIGDVLNVEQMSVEYDWFENNLYPSEDILNPEERLSESTQCLINAPSLMRSNHGLNYYQVKTPLAYAEILLPLSGADRIRRIVASYGDHGPRKIQVILLLDDLTPDYSIMQTEGITSGVLVDLLPKWWTSDDSNEIKYIMLRFIDNIDTVNWAYCSVADISAVTKDNAQSGFIGINGGSTLTKAQLVLKGGISDGGNESVSDCYTEFSAQSIDNSISNFRRTIILNNTSGSQLRYGFETRTNDDLDYGNDSGMEYQIWASGGIFNENPDSAEIRFNNDPDNGILTKDGKSLVLYPGDWVRVRLQKVSNTGNRFHSLVEINRSRPIVKYIETSLAGAISLSDNTTKYYNMDGASSAANFVTSDHTIGGRAIILVNRFSKPTVNSGTATELKGSAFVPSVNMHLEIQFYGVDVEYKWVEL